MNMLEIVIQARKALLAPGMAVKRILPFSQRRMVGPFIFMDHAGPVQMPPLPNTKIDVLPHPHIGLSTVSYLFDGKITHRDSLGVEQVIRSGEVNWMTAGKGISHSERFEDPEMLAGGKLELMQTWVALPEKDEEVDPSFVNYKEAQLPVFTDKGLWMRLIAGEAYGLKSNVKTHSPLFYVHMELQPETCFDLPKEHSERGVYVVRGSIEFDGKCYNSGELLVFKKGAEPAIRSIEAATIMLLGGEPLGERFIWWNFVSSKKERIEQAKEDWKSGRIILPQKDHDEFIPLPENYNKPASSSKKTTNNTPNPPPEPLS